jgi:hypothetical protein
MRALREALGQPLGERVVEALALTVGVDALAPMVGVPAGLGEMVMVRCALRVTLTEALTEGEGRGEREALGLPLRVEFTGDAVAPAFRLAEGCADTEVLLEALAGSVPAAVLEVVTV